MAALPPRHPLDTLPTHQLLAPGGEHTGALRRRRVGNEPQRLLAVRQDLVLLPAEHPQVPRPAFVQETGRHRIGVDVGLPQRPAAPELTTPNPPPYLSGTAQVAELVDALVSGTSAARRGGSSPLLGTKSLFLNPSQSGILELPRPWQPPQAFQFVGQFRTLGFPPSKVKSWEEAKISGGATSTDMMPIGCCE